MIVDLFEYFKNNPKYNKVAGRILTSANIQDRNTFEDPTKITPQTFDEVNLKDNSLEVTMPMNSVVVLELIE